MKLIKSGHTVDNDGGQAIANAISSGPRVSVVNWDRTAVAGSVGTFTDGPFGIVNGVILITVQVSGALPGGDGSFDNQGGESNDYCSTGSKDAAVIYASVLLDAGYNGLRIEFLFATNKPNEFNSVNPDSIGFFAYTDKFEQFAKFNDSVTGYSRSTVPESQVDLCIVACDQGDSGNDPAFLIKGLSCTEYESPPDGVEINYVKQTTMLERGERPYTQIIPASDTASGTSGTFIWFVASEETTTATALDITTADATTTTAFAEETTTTTTAAGIPTETSTTDESTATKAETSVGSTTTRETGTTATTESSATTEFAATDETTSTIEGISDQTTTTRSPCRPRRHLY
ncbi:unnamed protein product [Fusarium venenatum]|uniref:Uncharacterized protein n=1 Tax=Fusarium venenatum TaxID=56646 RepID=A0A2L2SXE3_9HYPO|nr:uncharacterized protein FVRRES_06990 [Fusarium venenatum]CEI62554.1 unnamed protein product [Fusarium venenatum]